MAEKIPFPKRPKYLPTVLSQEEIERLLKAARSLKHRALLMAMYGAGLRVSEACRLTIDDIDSSRMVIHVRQAKGKKDRPAVLEGLPVKGLVVSGLRTRQAGDDQGGLPDGSERSGQDEGRQDRLATHAAPLCRVPDYAEYSPGERCFQ
jgi:site-specific recombinase XerC